MNCTKDIFDTYIPGTTEGGQWELVGYSGAVNGPFGAGGNWPWLSDPNDHVIVDFNNIEQGFYRLNYFLPGDCGGQVGVTIPVVGGGIAGTTQSVTVCNNTGLLNIATALGASFDQGVLQADFSITGSGVTSGFYNAGSADTPLDDTFDPTSAPLGSYEFILSITPQSPVGFSLDNCDNCLPSTATLTVVVAESSITISIEQDGCWIYLDSAEGCSGGNLELQYFNGSNWIGLVGASLPYQATQDVDYRVFAFNCVCGNAFSNVVTASGCCVESPDFVIVQSSPCFLVRQSGTPCVGGTYLWYKSCDDGATWQSLPQFGDTDQLSIGDDCWYQLTRSCPSGCEQRSNILMVSGCASCSGSLTAVVNGCDLEVTAGPTCASTGTFLLQQNIGGSYTTVDTLAYSGYPAVFTITEDGTYRVKLDCDGDNCPNYNSNTVTFSGCESNTCDSGISIDVNECTITVNVTNCPAPFFVFKRLGNTVQSGSSNVYNALNNGVFDVEVYNCPNCSVLLGSVTLDMCGNNCSSSINASVSGCTVTASVTNCPSPTYIFKRGTITLQSGASNTYTHPTEESFILTVQATGCPGCSTLETTVSLNCIICDCTTSVTNTNCELFATDSNCAGYSADWRYFNGTSWVVKGTGTSIVPDANGLWQRRLIKSGCPTVTENIQVDCVVDACTLEITSAQVDPNDCNQILFTYQGATDSNMSVQLNYNQVGSTCGNAGGWTAFSGAAGTSFNFLPNGTGSGTIVVPESLQEKCIRIILFDNTSGCPAEVALVYFPTCCDDNPTIQVTGCAPYVLTVINAPAGASYVWSTGETTNSIEVYDGSFGVVVTAGACSYNPNVTVTCCNDPCLTTFDRCVHYNWLNALSEQTAGMSYITRFSVNGVDLFATPQPVQWSPTVFVPGSSNTLTTNPSIVNTLNALSDNRMAFELSPFSDYQTCFNTIPSSTAFLGLLRIISSTCVTSFEIVMDINNASPALGAGDYRFTETGLEVFSGGSWVSAVSVFGTTYMINDGPCDCTLIDLCA